MLRAVFDANVVVSAALNPSGTPGSLLAGFLSGRFALQLVVSPAILDEIRAAMRYPHVRSRLHAADECDRWVIDIEILADFVVDTGAAAGTCSDPDDDKYLAAAHASRAQYLVTGDRRVLALKEYRGVRIVSPREFLSIVEAHR